MNYFCTHVRRGQFKSVSQRSNIFQKHAEAWTTNGFRLVVHTLVCCVFTLTAVAQQKPISQTTVPSISRDIDASKYFRRFPDMPEGRNTSIQKAPAPALAELSERELGRPKITKCWLNMDEMWDYRTRKFVYDFPIGVHKYDGIKEKHGETWGGVAETRIPFPQYLKAFGRHSDEIMLTIRRYERGYPGWETRRYHG